MNYGDYIPLELTGTPVADNLRAWLGRLAARSPQQTLWVREHLLKYSQLTGESLDELAGCFPFHPAAIALLEKISHLAPSARVRLLAVAAQKIREAPIPADRPGFIAGDELWQAIRGTAEFKKQREVEAVLRCCAGVETVIQGTLPAGRSRELAVRLVHALALQRLATPDIYSADGITAAGLHRLLGLSPENDTTQDQLTAEIQAVLAQLYQAGRGPAVGSDPATGQYWLPIKQYKRFVKSELLLHWANALPFLILMGTGAVMLATRFFDWEKGWISWVELSHQISAATWLMAMPAVVMLRLNVHWAHIRAVLTWGRADALWMVQSMRAGYDKRAAIPPAGFINSGQKMNALLVLLYFFGFGVTGALMFFKGSILFPWYAHVALFFSAMGSVGGHLYLAMINPGTRIALPGIFHGWVPLKYVEQHHPLSLPPAAQARLAESGHPSPPGKLSVSRAEVVILIITLLLAGTGAFVFGKGRLESVKSQFSKSFSATINPSQLSTWHRVGPPAESCIKCHSYTGQIPNAKCEQCHEDIKIRRAQNIGYHGTFKPDCRICHQEHLSDRALVPFDRSKFKHDQAAFKLAGRHVTVECDDCHKKNRPPEAKGVYFTGLKFAACADCHPDPHNRQFAATCEKCHTTDGWRRPNLKFAHDTDSNFKLTGKHAQVECVKCHQPAGAKAALGTAKFKGLAPACVSCHADPHRGQFQKTCTDCHTTTGWRKNSLRFNHDRDTQYPLLGQHAVIACEKCHLPATPGASLASAVMHGLKTGCADCHQDPHRGQFHAGCLQCHPKPDSWTGRQLHFDHNRDAKFPLVGKHATAECVRCHQPQPAGAALASANFVNLKTGCADCHPVKHPAEYGQTCTSCHAVSAWTKRKPAADHASRNEVNAELLLGRHITARCTACHNPEKIPALRSSGAAPYDCITCHAKTDPHRGTLGAACYQCHGSEAWKGESLRFNHDTMTRYGLDQDHRKLACVKCHQNNHWKPINTACVSCHPKFLETKKDLKKLNKSELPKQIRLPLETAP